MTISDFEDDLWALINKIAWDRGPPAARVPVAEIKRVMAEIAIELQEIEDEEI